MKGSNICGHLFSYIFLGLINICTISIIIYFGSNTCKDVSINEIWSYWNITNLFLYTFGVILVVMNYKCYTINQNSESLAIILMTYITLHCIIMICVYVVGNFCTLLCADNVYIGRMCMDAIYICYHVISVIIYCRKYSNRNKNNYALYIRTADTDT